MAKAKKLKSGNWRTLVYDRTDENGKRHYESFTAPTKKESEYLAASYSIEKKRKETENDMTVGQAIDAYIDSKTEVLSPSTIRGYRYSRKGCFKSIMGIRLSDLRQVDVQNAINMDAASYSPKSIRNAHGLLTAALNMFAPSLSFHTTLPQKKESDFCVPSDDDIVKLLNTDDLDLRRAMLLAAFGSLRRGEVCAVTSNDINGNFLTINKAVVVDVNNELILKEPKTKSSIRTIELAPEIMKEFEGITGNLVDLSPDQLTKRFAMHIKRIGLDHITFHSLRHYQASILHALNIPDKYIMERGGWKTDAVLKKVYTHTMEQKSQEVARIANNYFSELIQHKMQHENK